MPVDRLPMIANRLSAIFIDFLISLLFIYVFILLGSILFSYMSQNTTWFHLSLHQNVEHIVNRYMVYSENGKNYFQEKFPQYVKEEKDSLQVRYVYFIPNLGYTYVKEQIRSEIPYNYPNAKLIGKRKLKGVLMEIPDHYQAKFVSIAKKKKIPYELTKAYSMGGQEYNLRLSVIPQVLKVVKRVGFIPIKIEPLYKTEREIVIDKNLIRSYVYLCSYVLFCLLLNILAIAAMESSKIQGTFGKLFMGLKVVDDDSKRITFQRACLRSLYRLLSMILFGYGYFYLLRKGNRTWHDMLSGTFVIDD